MKTLFMILFLFVATIMLATPQTLVRKNKLGNFLPGLSTSWKSINDKTIEMTMSPGVNADNVVSVLQKWFKRSVVEKKGDKKIVITTQYSLEQVLNRLSIISILPQKEEKVVETDVMDLMEEPGQKTSKVSLIEDEKVKEKGYFSGKVIEAKDSFPSVKLKIRITSVAEGEQTLKEGDIIDAEPYLKIQDGNPDTSDEDTADNMGALFLQKNDRVDGVIKEKDDTNSYKLLKVQGK